MGQWSLAIVVSLNPFVFFCLFASVMFPIVSILIPLICVKNLTLFLPSEYTLSLGDDHSQNTGNGNAVSGRFCTENCFCNLFDGIAVSGSFCVFVFGTWGAMLQIIPSG